MRIVFLDTETTGLEPGQICQLSYIVQEGNNLIKRVNQFFKVDYVDLGATKVNGLTKDMLDTLSKGKVFADRAAEFFEDFNGSLLVAHNINFDLKFIKAEFSRVGIDADFKHKLCTLTFLTNKIKLPGKYGGYKWPNVAESLKFLGFTEKEVSEFAKDIYGDHTGMAHDARYDATAVCLMVNKMIGTGVLNIESYLLPKE